MIYECTKQVSLPKCDDDGFEITDKYGIVPFGSKWCMNNNYSRIGGEVHLDAIGEVDDMDWIEVSMELLEECFALVKD